LVEYRGEETAVPENGASSREWWKSGVVGFVVRAALAVAFTVGFLLQGVHPLVAMLPVVLFALYALGTWWTWRNDGSADRR
jgi:hypothetical protein